MAPKRPNILAVILGGGAGTRLSPLTLLRSKPAVPLGGKYRLIDIPVSNCINSDILKIFVLTQYNSASLNKHIATTYRFSQFSNGFVEILAAEQTPQNPQWFQGTADAVRQVLPHISDWGIDTLLILSGDHLYRMDYRKFIARHFETEADVTISVIPFVREQAEDFGLMKMEPSGRIVEFREKPKGQALEEMRVDTTPFGLSAAEAARRPFLASMGIYVFKFDWLVELLGQDQTWNDFGKQVIPAAIETGNVQGYLFDTEAPIYTRARYLPPSKVNNCQITQSIVAEGCILTRASLHRSIIGIRTRIDFGAQIEDTYVMGADYYQPLEQMQADARMGRPRVGIGEGTVIRNAIVDKNARIGAGVRLVNERRAQDDTAPDGSWYIRDGIILIPKNAVIPDGTVV
ncbi:MAG TPA: sugar phosphate nucleotidyltransferase [Pyrinomonadaceae bacterium]